MRLRNPTLPLLCLLATSGCVETDSGPRVGDCAIYPEGQYGYGSIGVGSCLASPVDLTFIERDGSDWLAVTNADAFRNFSGGSVLLLDWASIESRLGERDILVHELVSEVIDTESFVSSTAWLPDTDRLIVARRLTEEPDGSPGRTRVGRDSAYVFDAQSGDEIGTLQLEDDPGDVVVDSNGRVYVLNYTDHSISVFDSRGDNPLLPIDIAPEAAITAFPLQSALGEQAQAELERVAIGDSTLVPDDLWTLTYLPGVFRAWIPGDNAVLSRWSTGGLGWQESGFADALDVLEGTEARDFCASFQVLQTLEDDQVLEILYTTGGTIRAVTNSGFGELDDWDPGSILLVAGADGAWDAVLGGPSRAVAVGGDAIYYDGRSAPGQPGSIGVAILDPTGAFVPDEAPILTPPAGQSYEQPFVQVDGFTNTARMWLSIWDGTRYVIGHTESSDGVTFPEPDVVLAFDDGGIAAPVVRYQDGVYQLWASRWDGATWTHVTATSPDGIDWGELTPITVSEASVNTRVPPRIAVEGNPSSTWRIEGADEDQSSVRILPGGRFVDIQHGYTLTVTQGQAFSRTQLFPLGRADNGVVPTSVVGRGDRDWVYVTITDENDRDRIAVLERDADDTWDVVAPDVIGRQDGGNALGVRSPLVFEHQGRFVMYYSARGADGFTRVRAATSTDGRSFTPVGSELFDPDVYGEWLAVEQEAHSIEIDADGSIRLFLSGNDGSRWRIGAVTAPALDATAPQSPVFTLDPARFEAEIQLGTGVPGGVDDSGVKDPAVITTDAGRFLYYSAFDGNLWHIARAEWDGTQWIRRTDLLDDVTLPAMSGRARTFSVGGAFSPVVRATPGGTADVFYAGTDDASEELGIPQVGYALGRGPHVFPHLKMPVAGDTLAYETERGDETISVIELAQNVDAFLTTGVGTTSLVLDEERGFLYVPSKLSDLLYIVDIRDDSREGFSDRNYLDLEGVASFETITEAGAFRGGVVLPGRDRAVFTTRNPDGLVWFDLSAIEDNDVKETTRLTFVATEALQDSDQDEGGESVAIIGGTQPALLDDRLFIPQFRDNSLSVFDLSLGTHGEEVGYVPNLGENPHVVAISPDQRWAVVANYAGDLASDGLASSTLAILDIDPTSPDYLTPVSWIRNRRHE